MKSFKNILVVVKEGSEANNPAIKRGIELAKKSQGRLTLMDVVAPPEGALSNYKDIIKPEEFAAMLQSRREKSLKALASDLDVTINVKVAVGKDFIEIIRQIIFGEHDLLIKLANEHAGGFDSSDFHLMRKCPQPVWLLKPEDKGKSKRILAAIDLKLESDEEGRALNAMIMNLSTSLAQWDDGEVHVLSCWSLYGESSFRHSGFLKVSIEDLDAMLLKEEQANQKRQDDLMARYSSCEIQGHLIKGEPVEHIPNFAKEHDIDVVVMGTVARTGIPGLLIGNTSESILHLIDKSVITVKPSGFETIIK